MDYRKPHCYNCSHGAWAPFSSADDMYCTMDRKPTNRHDSCTRYRGSGFEDQSVRGFAERLSGELHELARDIHKYLPEAYVLEGGKITITIDDYFTKTVRLDAELAAAD